MTDFPSPFERDFVPGYEFEAPTPIDITEHTTLERFANNSGRSFAVLLFEEGGEVPDSIAQWLHHRSYSDRRIKTQTADDKQRFGDIQAVKERFLRDQNGRRLYAAIDEETGELGGVVWLHALEGGETGADIIQACDVYNESQSRQEDKLDATKLATLASRMYSGVRHTGAHTPFLLTVLGDYYRRWPECEGIVIRMSVNDSNAVGAFSESNELKDYAKFISIGHLDGVDYRLNQGLTSPEDAVVWNPREHQA